MSEAIIGDAGGPSYSLFIEMAIAVGTTILAMYLCNSNRRSGTNLGMIDESKDTPRDVKSEKGSKDEEESDCEEKLEDEKDSTSLTAAPESSKIASRILCEKSTQTDQPEPGMDERILWKAVVVNAMENPKPIYRTELYVNVNGEISHTESFQTEGVVGVGMQQILAKVQ